MRSDFPNPYYLPLLGFVPAGFPSPAADYTEEEIDLKSYLMPNSSATFIMKIAGDSMIHANIPPGAHIIIDRSINQEMTALLWQF